MYSVGVLLYVTIVGIVELVTFVLTQNKHIFLGKHLGMASIMPHLYNIIIYYYII